MSTIENTNNLIINKIKDEASYDYLVANNLFDDNEIYLFEGTNTSVRHTAQELTDAQKSQARTNIGASAVAVSKTATLNASSWSNLSQTISVTGVTSSNIVIVSPAPTSHDAYCKAGVYCSTQAAGQLTFKCAVVPSVTLTVNIIIL